MSDGRVNQDYLAARAERLPLRWTTRAACAWWCSTLHHRGSPQTERRVSSVHRTCVEAVTGIRGTHQGCGLLPALPRPEPALPHHTKQQHITTACPSTFHNHPCTHNPRPCVARQAAGSGRPRAAQGLAPAARPACCERDAPPHQTPCNAAAPAPAARDTRETHNRHSCGRTVQRGAAPAHLDVRLVPRLLGYHLSHRQRSSSEQQSYRCHDRGPGKGEQARLRSQVTRPPRCLVLGCASKHRFPTTNSVPHGRSKIRPVLAEAATANDRCQTACAVAGQAATWQFCNNNNVAVCSPSSSGLSSAQTMPSQ